MSVPRSQASQGTPLQILDALLSHRGLPYPEGVKPTIRSHLSCLLQEFPGLQIKIEAFAQSDGTPHCLLFQVGGTIPISFLQVIYNIPVVIWLSKEYPLRAPLVFVTPSPFMIIRTAHSLVDPSGFVSCPLLRSWVSPPSNLVDLVHSLCVAFGHDPPLYSVMHPPHAHDVKFSMSIPLPSSSLLSASTSPSSALSTSVSLLGPGSPSQLHPLHANGAQVSLTQLPMSSASTTTSLLGPGSLSPCFPSHGHARELPMAHPSQPPSSAMASSSHRYFSYAYSPSVSIAQASSSLTSAGSPAPVSSSQQHPPHVYGAGVSMAHSLSSTSTSTSTSLLGPGKISHPSHSAGRHMVVPFPTELSKRPSLLTQGHSSPAYDVRLAVAHHPSPSSSSSTLTSTSTPASLLGPGKVLQMHPSHDANNISLAHLSLGQWHLPHTYSNGSLAQWKPLHTLGAGASMALLPTASTSASLLGAGSLSQRHAPHDHVGVSLVHPPHPSTSAPTSSSSLVPGTLLQQHPNVNHAYGAGELLHTSTSHVHNTGANSSSSISTMSSNPISLIPLQQNTGPPSTSLQQHFYPPAQCVQFSNPIFGTTDPPPDSRQSVINTLIGRLECDVDKIRKAKEMDMLNFMDIEGLLKQRQGLCEKGIQGLQQQKENLEVQLQTLLINTDFLETWLVANNKSDVNIDIDDDIFEPCDGLSNQLLECIALDLAIEDALYCLEKAAQEGQLPVDSYLKHVRTLSREQFFHRAIAVKVRAAQGQ